MSKMRHVAQITNSESHPVAFILEPWGDVFEMPAAASFDVYNETKSDGVMELRLGDKIVTVYGWVGSSLTVLRNGREPKRIPTEAKFREFLSGSSTTTQRSAPKARKARTTLKRVPRLTPRPAK